MYEFVLTNFVSFEQLQLRRYGVRQLPKKKMVTKLKEIYHYTHQGNLVFHTRNTT